MRALTAAAVAALLIAGCAAEPSGDAGAARRTSASPASTTAGPTPTATPTTPARDPALDRRLLRAAYRNDVTAAARLIAAGADVNHKDRSQQSAYLIATSEVGDDPRLLELTLAAGADVRSLDSYRGTGLIRAADRGNVRIVRRLLRTDIRVDHVNELGWTALHEAVILGDGSRRYVRTVRALVEAGADVDKPSRRDGLRPLQHARRLGHDAIARVLRSAGAR